MARDWGRFTRVVEDRRGHESGHRADIGNTMERLVLQSYGVAPAKLNVEATRGVDPGTGKRRPARYVPRKM